MAMNGPQKLQFSSYELSPNGVSVTGLKAGLPVSAIDEQALEGNGRAKGNLVVDGRSL